jgi:hypothetical protein
VNSTFQKDKRIKMKRLKGLDYSILFIDSVSGRVVSCGKGLKEKEDNTHTHT